MERAAIKDGRNTVAHEAVPPATLNNSTKDISAGLPQPVISPPETSPELNVPPPEKKQGMALNLKQIEIINKLKKERSTEPAVEEKVKYDFPVILNRQVKYYLNTFQTRDRESFAGWLARSSRYLPMIKKYLKEFDLPLDLAYLPMIESGYSQTATSRAKAVGLWQFIRSTARFYGLTVNNYVDERKDPVKSTRAAAAYLADLYQEFGSWDLAVAAYNAGSGKIRQSINKYNTKDFWKLAQHRHLKQETKHYVPRLIAAIIIARDPAKHGFSDIAYEPALKYETIEVPRWTPLTAVSLAGNIKMESLRKRNRELRKPFTPPDRALYHLRVPGGKKKLVARNLPRVHATVTTNYKTHTVKNNESLTAICRRYGLTKTIILKANNLRAAELMPGQRLRIPYQTTAYALLPENNGNSRLMAASSKENFVLHKIQPGENVSQLAHLYNVPEHLIAAWNDLEDINRIKAGQLLAIFIEKTGSPAVTAQNKKIFPPDGLTNPGASQKAGEKITKAEETDTPTTYYHVQSGDSLWGIAKKYKIHLENIKIWNNLKDDIIYPGNLLLLKLAADVDV